MRLKEIAQRFKREVRFYGLVLADPRTPRLARWLLGLALAYAAMPFDLIPDFIPVLGLLDDAVILPLLVWLALTQVPHDVLVDCRSVAWQT